ncbi:PAS domain S-box-containing protein [[Luteovulum] sphaeroides subsp. megalophilum]|uniref:HWE histidine kinase domain-containing protein n=1 Tax=Cereibacter sphaeroides TaxID=1063 RepID=UPI000B6C8512|nr:HWE histidine kinase domain-containing protein [Cereibacter sphaeroides]SNT28141.1 PAS domain S-box-containing protein [[Luteovulum] sphaeroides subsp. megalophilum]
MAEDGLHAWLELIVPEDRALALDGIERVRLGEHVSSELRIRRPVDGELRWLRNSAFPLRDPLGALHRIGGIGHDITEEKRVGERLQVLVAELQHRTRNLLTVVPAIAACTLSSAGSLADFRTRFEDRLLALARVNGLLSRLEEGRPDHLRRADLGRARGARPARRRRGGAAGRAGGAEGDPAAVLERADLCAGAARADDQRPEVRGARTPGGPAACRRAAGRGLGRAASARGLARDWRARGA